VLFNGLAQGKFIICGSYWQGVMEASRSHTLHFYSFALGPIGLIYRHCYDLVVAHKMGKYRPFKTLNSK